MSTECTTNDVYSTVLVLVAYIEDGPREVLQTILFLEIIFIYIYIYIFQWNKKVGYLKFKRFFCDDYKEE